MAYFANGTEIDYYIEKCCQECAHYGILGENCPVLDLHFLWNYIAMNGDSPKATPEQKAKFEALETLWPRDGSHNGECRMFIGIESESKC